MIHNIITVFEIECGFFEGFAQATTVSYCGKEGMFEAIKKAMALDHKPFKQHENALSLLENWDDWTPGYKTIEDTDDYQLYLTILK